MKREIITTADGSHTFYLPELQESYHSVHGAVQESKHVYINAALLAAMPLFQEIRLLEVGFGTGLNALLTLLANNTSKKIYYCGIEAFPMTESEIQKLNYSDILGVDNELFQSLHDASWDVGYEILSQRRDGVRPVSTATTMNIKYEKITPVFYLKKLATTLQDVSLPENYFNVVYFDAFAPSVQPELWESEIFEKVYASMSTGGIMTTYSAKGSVRRVMQQTGFTVERLPAPAGKREMLRAIK